ncbi:glutamine--scyllo-inositol aminotransferase [SAR202 cluster bacterium AD-802-F09_MRT_200m]|nr:glutamine--scyllo-inositol aminotransferase [SAR202 cluster bacterium AD-802-F09_MRT_200m]
MPARMAFGDQEVASLMSAVDYYRANEQDPPYQGHFEELYCEAIADFMGGGYADAVSSGTAAVFVALAALDLPPKSEVIISPVTDSGPLNCIILQGFVPVVADSAPDSYNMGVEQFLERVTPNTSAVLAVHCAGEQLEIDLLVEEAHERGIKVLEDVSQATGAVWKGKKLGTFGDIAAFSTMYRKTLSAGASSGFVYSLDIDTYHRALAHADRGKPIWEAGRLNLNDPGLALFPALNFNTNELSCAIGHSSLNRLQESIDRRVSFLSSLIPLIESNSRVCRPYAFNTDFSPFFYPIFVDADKLACSKIDFAKALIAEGIDLHPDYGCVVRCWTWAEPYFSDDFMTTNAISTRDRSFNLFLNERYGEEEVQDVISAIVKVENFFSKS